MARLLPVNGNSRDVSPANGKFFVIDELYKLIGCTMVEVVPLPDGRKLVIDEEGKLQDKPLNLVASFMAKDWLQPDDFISGTALLMTDDEVEAVE